MKRRIAQQILVLFFTLTNLILLSSWGIWGHQHINKSAIFALPEDLRTFFYNHVDFIVEESTIPDLRKYTINDKAENPRHFIDIEEYENMPIDSLAQSSKAAIVAYDNKLMQKSGLLPWYIQDIMEKLTKSMKEKRRTEILFLAADLGHYLGDANMPLHTTNNHNGQMTNQNGIHALWESQLPEMVGDNFNFHTENAKYIDDIPKETWRIIKHSHKLVDTLLAADKEVRKAISAENIFQKDDTGKLLRNKFNQTIYTKEYASLLQENLKGMIENQLRSAISSTADFWYTAWVNAGKPDLKSLDNEGITKRNKEGLKEDLKAWEKGKLQYLKAESEF